ncbi:MAG: glycosyltransferase family 4 protein [Chloroflexi bacterium]|jgi:glycosyltransferase involved in cell wall biosynthesis|nr:glycosyltransferase family 4 protein [Chloroflexota bacterium]
MSDPLRVLLITGEYPPMEGGVGDFTHLLGVALADQGAEVHVLTSAQAATADDNDSPSQPGTAAIPGGRSPVRRHALMPSWGWMDLYGRARQLIQQIRPDVVNIQYQAAAYAMHPAIHLFPYTLRPIPCVTTFHDLLVPYLFPKAGPLRRQAVLTLARSSHAAIVTNPEDEQQLGTISGVARLIRIPIGSNIPCVLPRGYERQAWRERYGIAPDACVLCYFGFLNASKGGEDLIDAFDSLCRGGYNVHLLMIGGEVGASDPTNREYLAHVRRTIVERGLTDRVTWTGFMASDEVSAAFASSDVCVLPYRDGVSLRRGSLMAALTHGMPIVSTEPRVSLPELVHGGNMLLTPAANPRKLADTIARLAENEELRQQLGAGARALAQEYDWDRIAARTLEVYYDVAGR